MKINFFLTAFCLTVLIGCSSDSNELDPTVENNNDDNTEEVIIVANEDTTEEIVMSSEDIENGNIEEEEEEEEEEIPSNNGSGVLSQEEQLQLDFATTSIFDRTSNNPNSNAKKWNSTINLFLSGDFSNSEINFINEFSEELNTISSAIDMNIVPSFEESNVEIYFATTQEYISNRPNFIEGFTPNGSSVGRANTRFRIPSFFITGNKIWVDTSALNFNSVIRHEILHILGLDHTEDPESILFGTPNTDFELTDNDIFTIQTLYNPLIQASFTQNQVTTSVENNREEFFN